jgi:pSer/pThr/pTyr-binding forkhead associated (FHA) protein
MRSWVIGSRADCAVVIDSPIVSGRHCQLTQGREGFFLEDLGSSNGTYVDGSRITGSIRVAPGMAVTLGQTLSMPWPSEVATYINIGRDAGNEIVLDGPGVSSRHARIMIVSGFDALIEDIGSSNGTFLNSVETRVTRLMPLKISDTVYFGGVAVPAERLLAGRSDTFALTSASPSPSARGLRTELIDPRMTEQLQRREPIDHLSGAGTTMASESDPFEFRKFLEKLRRLLQVQDPASEGELPALLQEYDQLCERANQRLRECFTLSQRGQYSNAVLVSEREPNLLDQCTQLEIPERDMLASVAQIVNAKRPTLVDRDLFAALQECYEKGSNAATNLKMLQRLTLARAPLPTRLAVMRRLSVQNPNHPYLDGDIRVFEKAWFKRASEFAQPFVKLGRPEVIEEIVQDLQEGGYLEAPPNSLLPQLRTQLGRARSTLLPMLADEIRAAFVERSYLSVRQMAERWKSLTGTFGSPDDDRRYGISDPMAWVRNAVADEIKTEERDQARLDLIEIIDAPDSTRDDLDSAYHKAKALGAIDVDLESRFNSRLARLARRKIASIVGAVAASVLVLALFVVVIRLPGGPSEVSVGEKDHIRNDSMAGLAKTVEAMPSDGDVKMRKMSNEQKVLEFGNELAALKEATTKLLADASHGRVDARKCADAEELRTKATILRERAREWGRDVSDLVGVEKRLAEVGQWKTLADSITGFRKEMWGASGTLQTLQRLASFLEQHFGGLVPDAELARKAKLGPASLPSWSKAVEIQEYLQSAAFLKASPQGDEWNGHPPSGALAAARAHAESMRQRDASIDGTESALLKERLARSDIADLWRINVIGGDEWAYWYTKSAVPKGGMPQVKVLLDASGRVEQTPIPANRNVIRAPQSDFGKAASKRLWEPTGKDRWERRVADVYDKLIDSTRIDPLLRLELLRSLLSLANNSSAGYQELFRNLAAYQEITGREGDIQGNWLDPGQHDVLSAKRQRAEKLILISPRLGPLVDDATARGEKRLGQVKQGLVLLGWICRAEEGTTMLERFAMAEVTGGSRLFAVVEKNWIELGEVSPDGKEIKLNPAAEQHIGWPVFAVLSAKSRAG